MHIPHSHTQSLPIYLPNIYSYSLPLSKTIFTQTLAQIPITSLSLSLSLPTPNRITTKKNLRIPHLTHKPRLRSLLCKTLPSRLRSRITARAFLVLESGEERAFLRALCCVLISERSGVGDEWRGEEMNGCVFVRFVQVDGMVVEERGEKLG